MVEIVATRFCEADVLEAVPTKVGQPQAGEVVISVRAIGVNHRDYKTYTDRSYTLSRSGKLPDFPLRLGVEAAGVVTAVGEKASGPDGPIIVGDEVIAYRIAGAYADMLVAAASAVCRKPSKLTWEQAGSMMLSGTTAAHALAAICARHGQTILIHGAGGGVGLSAVQLAALDGIKVIGTCGEKDFETLRRYGAEPVLYRDGLLERVLNAAPRGVDGAIDLVGTDEAINTSLKLISDLSRIATIVAIDRASTTGIQYLGGTPNRDPVGLEVRMSARMKLTALAQAGVYDVPVPIVFPLANAADAHRLLAKGAAGRIVLIP